jgi:O-antigen/teichoic acid export membrane protein
VLVAETLSRLIPILTIGFAARMLGVAAFGQAHILLSAIDLGLVLVAFGYNYTYNANRPALDPAAPNLVSSGDVAWTKTIIRLRFWHATAASLLIGVGLYAIPTFGSLGVPFLWLTPFLLLASLDCTHHFVHTRQTASLSVAVTTAKIALLALIVVLVDDTSDMVLYAALMLSTNAVVHGFSWWVWKRDTADVRWHSTPKQADKNELNQGHTPGAAGGILRLSLPHATALVLLLLIERADWLVGNASLSQNALGEYVGMTKTLLAGSGIIVASMAPFLSEYQNAQSRAEFSRFAQLAIAFSGGLGALAILTIGCFPHLIFPLVLGKAFSIDPKIALVAACGIAGHMVFYVAGFQLLQVRGRAKLLIAILTGGLLISLVPLLMPLPGVVEVTAATAVARMAMATAAVIAIRPLVDSVPHIAPRLLTSLILATALAATSVWLGHGHLPYAGIEVGIFVLGAVLIAVLMLPCFHRLGVSLVAGFPRL